MAEPVQEPRQTRAAASAPAEASAAPAPHDDIVDEHVESARVRRSPKFAVFLAVGAAFGLIVAMILTFAFGGTDGESPNTGLLYSQTQVFGFLALIFVTVGIAAGGMVAVIFDRVLARRSREVRVDRERIRTVD